MLLLLLMLLLWLLLLLLMMMKMMKIMKGVARRRCRFGRRRCCQYCCFRGNYRGHGGNGGLFATFACAFADEVVLPREYRRHRRHRCWYCDSCLREDENFKCGPVRRKGLATRASIPAL